MTEWRYFKFNNENVGNLNAFQEKFIILRNNGYKIWKNRKNQNSKLYFGYKTKENQ